MGPDSQDIVIPISITIPDPRPRMVGGRRPPQPHRAGIRDPGWFRRHYTPQPVASYGESHNDLSHPNTRPTTAVEEFRFIARTAREIPTNESRHARGFDIRKTYQNVQTAALGPYTGPPLPPDIDAAFHDLALTAQELADNFYLNHPGIINAPPTVIDTILHDDFYRTVQAMSNPRYHLEYSRKGEQPARRGAPGSVRTDVEYVDPNTGAVLAVLDYKTTADPDFSPGDLVSIGARRTQQIREALAEQGTVVDPLVPIVGITVIVPPN